MHALDVRLRRLTLATALLGAGLLLSTGAQATASASSSLTNLHVTLLDLDGAGGTAPSITFAGGLSIGDVEQLSIPLSTISGTWNTGTQTMSLGFELGANTGVRFSVDYLVSAKTQLLNEFAAIGVVFATGDFSSADYNNWVVDDYGIDWASAYDGGQQTRTGTFSVASYNQGSGMLSRYVGIGGTSYGTSVSAVPEPENALMFLAGMAVLGGLARRRTLR